MYRQPAFREDRLDILRHAMRDHPLATLITAGPAGLQANLLPFLLRSGADGDVLCAHLAKANEQVADLRASASALILFQGPQGYVSPSWYATKAEHGRVVPTWNYIMVQARGTARVIEDPLWLHAQLDELTASHEAGRAERWRITDAPDDYIAGQTRGIVGIEMPIEQIEGKWKLSQNHPAANRAGVVAGLKRDGNDQLATAVERAAADR